MPNDLDEPLALEVVDGAMPALVAGPLVGPHVELLQVDRRHAEVLRGSSRSPRGCSRAGTRRRACSPAARATCRFFGRNLRGDDQRLVAMAGEHAAEELLALAVAVGERRVEERAAERDGPLDGRDRLVVIRARPAADPPEPVADFRDGPTDATEGTGMHKGGIISGARVCGHAESAVLTAMLLGVLTTQAVGSRSGCAAASPWPRGV